MVEITREQLRQPFCKFKCQTMARLKGRGIRHFIDLRFNCPVDFIIAMTGVDTPQAGATIQNLLTIFGRVIHACGGFYNPGVFLKSAIGRKRHPIGACIFIKDGHADQFSILFSPPEVYKIRILTIKPLFSQTQAIENKQKGKIIVYYNKHTPRNYFLKRSVAYRH